MNLRLICASVFITLLFSIMFASAIQQQVTCTYDKEIALQKARFDFVNAYYGYPYDKVKTDFAYAFEYARCK